MRPVPGTVTSLDLPSARCGEGEPSARLGQGHRDVLGPFQPLVRKLWAHCVDVAATACVLALYVMAVGCIGTGLFSAEPMPLSSMTRTRSFFVL